jgi:hypothetical protein
VNNPLYVYLSDRGTLEQKGQIQLKHTSRVPYTSNSADASPFFGDNKIKFDFEYQEVIIEPSVYAYISETVSLLRYKVPSLLFHPNHIKTDGLFETPHV